jgi:glycine dehydrogenase
MYESNSFKGSSLRSQQLKRELPLYIPNDQEIDAMLKCLGVVKLDDIFSHIPPHFIFEHDPNNCQCRESARNFPKRLPYYELIDHVQSVAKKNRIRTSFIGDGLKHYTTPDIVPLVAQVRGLTTAYTPSQPERCQGTLHSLRIYFTSLC